MLSSQGCGYLFAQLKRTCAGNAIPCIAGFASTGAECRGVGAVSIDTASTIIGQTLIDVCTVHITVGSSCLPGCKGK